MLQAVIKGADAVSKEIRREFQQSEKDLNIAMRIEGFRLMKQMRSEISHGRPGGVPFHPLSEIGRRTMAKRLQGDLSWKRYGMVGQAGAAKRRPLRRLASAVRYAVRKKKDYEVAVGFPAEKLSKSWVRIARRQQEGASFSVSEELRTWLRMKGALLRKKGDPAARYFFLKKSTGRFRTPARPILGPFWRVHRAEAWQNIRENFRRKQRGERI